MNNHLLGRRTKYVNLAWVTGSGDQSARGQGLQGPNLVQQVYDHE